MSINWSLFLAHYQQDRGGFFFGGDDEDCSCQLVLTEGEKSPLLVSFDTQSAGRTTFSALKARTMVRLERPYELHIRPGGLVGGGVKEVAGLLGKNMDFGYPEATKGRIITQNNAPFTKLVLGSLELRNALTARKRDRLWIRPGPRADGWHLVEVSPATLEGSLGPRSPWEVLDTESVNPFLEGDELEASLQDSFAQFNQQMDGFLDLLRAARDAVTQWPM